MNVVVILIAVWTTLSPVAQSSAASLSMESAAAGWPDTLTLTTGAVVRCRILKSSPSSLVIEYPRAGTSGGTPLTREVPWSAVRSTDFSMDPEFHRLLDSRDPIKDTPRLAARWSALAPMIGRPQHPAGDLALALARLSLHHPESSARHRAIDAIRAVVASDWNPSRRQHAQWLHAQLLSSLGRKAEAISAAVQLTKDPATPPDAAMPAMVLVARADFAALKKLQEDNPKWTDDDIVRPERDTLLHRALDGALTPSVRHGDLEGPAGDGLWTAIEILEFAGHIPAAADAARDLITLYPASPRSAAARDFLNRHRLALTPDPTPKEPPPVTTANTSPPPPNPETPEPTVHRRPRYAPQPPSTDLRPPTSDL